MPRASGPPSPDLCDVRTEKQCSDLNQQIALSASFSLPANPALPNFTLTKLPLGCAEHAGKHGSHRRRSVDGWRRYPLRPA